MTPEEQKFAERYKPSPAIQEALQEKGYPAPQPEPPTGPMPPLDGLWAVPHFAQFTALMDWTSRTYFWTYDNAIADSRLNAQIMRDDYIIFPALQDRTRPVCQLDWHLEPLDPSNARLKANADKLTTIMKRIPKFQDAKRAIMEYLFFGRSGLEWKPAWDYSYDGTRQLIVADWFPTHADSILFKYDGDVGVLINITAFESRDWISTPRGPAHFFTPAERELFVVGEFQSTPVDYYQPERSGAIKGLGYRGTLYWIWWLREKLTAILMDFLEKVGTGITIFFYEAGNAKSKAEVVTAAKEQIGNNVFIFPRNRDGQSAYAGPGIERVEVSMQGAQTFLGIYNLLNNLMRMAIMGEVGTTQEMSSGLGSSIGEQHGKTADERVKYDAVTLEWPMQQWTNTLNRWNCPGDPAPLFQFMVDKRNPEEFMSAVNLAVSIGLEVSENQIRDELGLPKPQPGEPTIGKMQALQPTAVNAVPQGVPMSGPTGPDAQAAQQDQPDDGGQPQPSTNGSANGTPLVQGIPIQSSVNGTNRMAGLPQ